MTKNMNKRLNFLPENLSPHFFKYQYFLLIFFPIIILLISPPVGVISVLSKYLFILQSTNKPL